MRDTLIDFGHYKITPNCTKGIQTDRRFTRSDSNEYHFYNVVRSLLSIFLSERGIDDKSSEVDTLYKAIVKLDLVAKVIDDQNDNRKLSYGLSSVESFKKIIEQYEYEINSAFSDLILVGAYLPFEEKKFRSVLINSIDANLFYRESSYEIGTTHFNINTFGYLFYPLKSFLIRNIDQKFQDEIVFLFYTYFHILNFCDDVKDFRKDIHQNINTPLSCVLSTIDPKIRYDYLKYILKTQLEIWLVNLNIRTKGNVGVANNLIITELKKMLMNLDYLEKHKVKEPVLEDLIPPVFCYS